MPANEVPMMLENDEEKELGAATVGLGRGVSVVLTFETATAGAEVVG